MKNQIYYLLDFHKKCSKIITYDKDTIIKYCTYVNFQLNRWFSIEEQKQLQLYDFDHYKLSDFVYDNVDDVSFDGLDENKLYDLFNSISYVDLYDF